MEFPPFDFSREERRVTLALERVGYEVRRAERAERARYADPLTELYDAFQRNEPPALAWVVRWSNEGRTRGLDPLAAAWEHSGDSRAMVWILRKTGHEYLARRVEAAAQSKELGAVARAVPLTAVPPLDRVMTISAVPRAR